MGIMGLMGIETPFSGAVADPQLLFFENFGAKLAAQNQVASIATLSVHAVNVPLSISFGTVCVLISSSGTTARTQSVSFGLYSLNGSTLSLANSASGSGTNASQLLWMSLATSATQNISPGAWYFALNMQTAGAAMQLGAWCLSANAGNAIPTMLRGRMTASTNAMPGSIATSDLDITGSDAMRQPYIVVTA